MKSLTKASRINAVNKIIQHMNSGMTVVEACREVGMPRCSFYYIVEHNPRDIADIQAIIDISNRKQLALLLQNKLNILEKVNQDGLSDKTSPRARLASLMNLTQLADELMDTLQRDEGQDVSFLLTGPKLVKAESRFASR